MAAPPIAERHLHHFHRRSPIKESVRVATTANITIATALNNGDTLDGITLATDDRVLVKDQTAPAENGLYVVAAVPVRDYDQSTVDPAFGFLVRVRQGTVNSGKIFANTNTSVPTIGTTGLTFAETGSSATTSDDRDLVGALSPSATVTLTKDAGNPTFNFSAIPETVTKVGSTYYGAYQGNWGGTTDIRMATATDRDGPWTALSTLLVTANVAWAGATDHLYAPEIVEVSGTFYLFFSTIHPTTNIGKIGVATASAVTGPYTDSGAAILSPSAAGLWDSFRVGEPSAIYHDGRWVMAYMGEDTDFAHQDSERVGVATAAAATGPWTRAAGNPLIDWGANGTWDDNLTADPFIFFENGYYWIWYTGGSGAATPHTPWQCGLAYALDPTGTWTKWSTNPLLLVGSGGAFDETAAWRGSVYVEDGLYSGVYGGATPGLAAVKGGNFRLTVASASSAIDYAETADLAAVGETASAGVSVEVPRADHVHTIADEAVMNAGYWDVVVSGSAPPVAVSTPSDDDWVVAWVNT